MLPIAYPFRFFSRFFGVCIPSGVFSSPTCYSSVSSSLFKSSELMLAPSLLLMLRLIFRCSSIQSFEPFPLLYLSESSFVSVPNRVIAALFSPPITGRNCDENTMVPLDFAISPLFIPLCSPVNFLPFLFLRDSSLPARKSFSLPIRVRFTTPDWCWFPIVFDPWDGSLSYASWGFMCILLMRSLLVLSRCRKSSLSSLIRSRSSWELRDSGISPFHRIYLRDLVWYLLFSLYRPWSCCALAWISKNDYCLPRTAFVSPSFRTCIIFPVGEHEDLLGAAKVGGWPLLCLGT